MAKETMVTSTGRNGNSKTTLAKDSAVWKKNPFETFNFSFTKKLPKFNFCVYILFSIYEVVNTPPKYKKNGVPCKIPCSLAIKNRRPSPMPKIALSHKQNCNQFVKERNILFNICQCTTTSIWIFAPKMLLKPYKNQK